LAGSESIVVVDALAEEPDGIVNTIPANEVINPGPGRVLVVGSARLQFVGESLVG
jgi:hypothetical protein